MREGKAVTPNEYFPEYRTGTYGYFVSYFVTRAFEVQVLGSRRPEASLFLDNPYYFETRNGATLRLAVGRRLSFNASGELGSNRYVNPVLVTATGEIVTRIDDTTRCGGGFDFKVSQGGECRPDAHAGALRLEHRLLRPERTSESRGGSGSRATSRGQRRGAEGMNDRKGMLRR